MVNGKTVQIGGLCLLQHQYRPTIVQCINFYVCQMGLVSCANLKGKHIQRRPADWMGRPIIIFTCWRWVSQGSSNAVYEKRQKTVNTELLVFTCWQSAYQSHVVCYCWADLLQCPSHWEDSRRCSYFRSDGHCGAPALWLTVYSQSNSPDFSGNPYFCKVTGSPLRLCKSEEKKCGRVGWQLGYNHQWTMKLSSQ